MANLSFNFNKIPRSFFNVTLKDDRKLQVKMPRKKTFEKLQVLQKMDEETAEVEDIMDTFGALCAETLSNNLKGEKVTTKYITDNYDFEKIIEFLKQFYAFVSGAANSPN